MQQRFRKNRVGFFGLHAVCLPERAGSGAEVKTSYFTLELPGDWIQPQATQEVNGMVSVVFANKRMERPYPSMLCLLP